MRLILILNKVKPKLATYFHIVKLHGLDKEELLKRTKANYLSRFLIVEDLKGILVGDRYIASSLQKK